jgi:hypothetical protein
MVCFKIDGCGILFLLSPFSLFGLPADSTSAFDKTSRSIRVLTLYSSSSPPSRGLCRASIPGSRTRCRSSYFDMGMEDPSVVAAIGHGKYSVCWTGALTPQTTGECDLTVRTGMWNRTATARLFLDDKELTLGTGHSTQKTSTQFAMGSGINSVEPMLWQKKP